VDAKNNEKQRVMKEESPKVGDTRETLGKKVES
jgi:hypothetical protein